MEIVGFCGSVGGDEVSVNEVSQAPMGRRQLVTMQNTVLHNIYSISWSKTSKYCCFSATKEKAAAFLRQRLHIDLQLSVLEGNIVIHCITAMHRWWRSRRGAAGRLSLGSRTAAAAVSAARAVAVTTTRAGAVATAAKQC